MITYIEKYSNRGKCTGCGDILWTSEVTHSVVCKCGLSSIRNGVCDNIEVINDQEMIDYITSERGDNDSIILLQV